jgi:hypothetical protein
LEQNEIMDNTLVERTMGSGLAFCYTRFSI